MTVATEVRRRTVRKSRYLAYALHAAVLAGILVAAVKYIDSDQFLRGLRHFHWQYAPLIMALATGSVLLKGWRFVFQLHQLSPVNRWVVLRGYLAGQACTLLPGGIAARAGILEQVGVPVTDSSAAVAVSSLSDQVVLILCSLLMALWFEPARKAAVMLLSVLLVLSVLLGIEATRTWLLGVVEWLMGKVRLLGYWRQFLDSFQEVTTLPVLLGSIGNSVLAYALIVQALDIAVRGVGAQVPYSTLLLAFALPSLMGRISAMPGGVGVTEAGMVGILNAAPGVTLDQAAAAAVVFRVGTVLFAAILGGLVYAFSWRGTAEAASRTGGLKNET
jgi:uncharacterized protein (TIRG00374 family)